jgi:hypothetical protein
MILAVIDLKEPNPKLLEELAADSVRGIREYLRIHTRGSGDLSESIRANVYGKQVIVESDMPYAASLDRGTSSRRTMWNLINKVIPLKLKDGRTIFRRVTLSSILRGKWQHGPKLGTDYAIRGIELAVMKSVPLGLSNIKITRPV